MDDIDTKYKFLRKIWGTSKSNIWLCEEKVGGKFVVAKEIFKSHARRDPNQIWAERDCLEYLSANFGQTPKLIETAKTENSLFFILELVVGAPLHMHVPRAGISAHGQVIFFFARILDIIEFLHAHKIVYRDIKLSNFILSRGGEVFVCDFGAAKRLSEAENVLTGKYGTTHAMAPEIIAGSAYGFSVDFWSLGILLFELMEGHPPWKAGFPEEQRMPSVPFTESKHTAESKDLIRRLLEVNVPDRLCDFPQIRSHAFLRTEPASPRPDPVVAEKFIFGDPPKKRWWEGF